jgi:hypothetical protein
VIVIMNRVSTAIALVAGAALVLGVAAYLAYYVISGVVDMVLSLVLLVSLAAVGTPAQAVPPLIG